MITAATAHLPCQDPPGDLGACSRPPDGDVWFLAQALLAAFRSRLGAGYATATPDTLQRRFLDSSGTISISGDTVTVRIDRRAYSPVLRQASLPADTTVPWWHGRRLHFEFS